MAKRNRTANIAVIAIILIGLTLLVIYALSQKRVSWSESYKPDDKEPYGTYVLYTLLTKTREGQPFVMVRDSVFKELPPDPSPKEDTYLYIGSEYYGDSTDVDQLLKFVAAGNNAFLICDNPYNLVFDSLLRLPVVNEEEIYTEYDDQPYELADDQINRKVYSVLDNIITVHLDHHELERREYDLARRYNYEIAENKWSYFKDSLITYGGDQVEVLGSFDQDYVNYMRFQYGKGTIYLHSTPIVFTNYFMMSDTAMNYCRSALKFIGDGIVYWDEDNRTFDYKAQNHSHNYDNDSDPSKPEEGPLEFILSEPSLRIAWYLLIFGALLYLMFGAKRKQRIIAPTENMENTSIEYAQVLSQMFMKQSDHKKLVLMKMDLFKAFLRERFNIRLPQHMKDEDEKLYKEISDKSNVRQDLVKDIFEQYKYLSAIVVVNTPEMLQFHNRIETFFENCK